MKMGFTLGETLLYKRESGTVVGKRYGHAQDIWVGRCYDLKVLRGTYTEVLKDIPEKELMREVKENLELGLPAPTFRASLKLIK